MRVFRVVGCGSRTLTSAGLNKITLRCLHLSITCPRSEARLPPITGPHPSSQFDPDPATCPSNPGSASKRREPRSLNLEMLSTTRGSRSVDHGPMCLALGPRTRVQVQARYQYIDLRQARRNACQSRTLHLSKKQQ